MRSAFDDTKVNLTEEQMIKINQLAQGINHSFDRHIRLRNDICSSWIIEYVNKMMRVIEEGERNDT